MANSEWRMENYRQTILLTGRRGVGKTTLCQAVAELARRRGYRPGGVITPALYACPEPVEGPRRRVCPADWELGIGNWELTKVGFEALDVGSGQRWPLARTDQKLDGPRVGPYSFDPAGLARALEVLRRAATAGYDLFMVDEIGPLELEQGKGFAPVLDLVHWRSSRTVRLSSPEPCSAPAERETVRLSLRPELRPRGSPEPSFATPEENSEDSLSGERPMHTLIVVRPALLDPLRLHLRDTESAVFSVTVENRDELPLWIVEALWGDQHHCSVR